MSTLDQAAVGKLLQQGAIHHVAALSTIKKVGLMRGNAGLSFGFDIQVGDAASFPKPAPPGNDPMPDGTR